MLTFNKSFKHKSHLTLVKIKIDGFSEKDKLLLPYFTEKIIEDFKLVTIS